jgi:hypothetical protein
MHSTCWSHILHLVSEELRSSMKMADKYISCVKSALIKAPARRGELLETLQAHTRPLRLPPVPVITRWCTWLQAGEYHFNNFEAEIDWITKTEDNSAAVKTLKKICNKSKVKIELNKIQQLCQSLSSTIRAFEKNGLPARDVWLLRKTVEGVIEEVMGQKSPKLFLYMSGKQPALEFWKDVQYLDPRKVQEQGSENLPESLTKFSVLKVNAEEVVKYKIIRQTLKYGPEFCPFEFWRTYGREMPVLSKLSLAALSIPASTSEVERSFSALKRTLTPQRSSLTEENLGNHLRLTFNENQKKECSPTDESEDDFED